MGKKMEVLFAVKTTGDTVSMGCRYLYGEDIEKGDNFATVKCKHYLPAVFGHDARFDKDSSFYHTNLTHHNLEILVQMKLQDGRFQRHDTPVVH